MDYSKMNTKTLLTMYRIKKSEYAEIQYHTNIVEPDNEELKKLAKDIVELKNELDNREHVKTKKENKTTRQIRAKKYRGGRRSHKKKN